MYWGLGLILLFVAIATSYALGLIVFLLVVAVAFGCLVVTWGIADAAKRPEYAWSVAGQNKTLWMALQAGALLFLNLPGGVVMAVVYLAAIRPKVRAAEETGPNAAQPSSL